jgi:two-component system, chemotaxis family, chemotaxis protein CheY
MVSSTNKQILIVEDAQDIQLLLGMLFDGEGYASKRVSNGQEALEYLRTAPNLPGLILLDLMMPVMDGYAFREAQMKDARLSSLPVVVMTADLNATKRCQQLGITAFVKKPIDIDDMLSVASENFLAS